MSDGCRIRAAELEDCDALGLVTVTASLGAFLGHIPEPRLDLTWTPADSAEGWRTTLGSLPAADLFLVVESGDLGVVGFVWAGPSSRRPSEGEVRGLYVLPTQQGRGLGRLLLSDAVRHLRDRSFHSLLVGCVRENPSCDFYRHLGGVEVFTEPATVDRHETEEVFFAWPDMTLLG